MLALGLLCAGCVPASSTGATEPSPARTPAAESVRVGEFAHLRGGPVPVAATEEAYDASARADAAHDLDGLVALAHRGAVFVVVDGTAARVLKRGGTIGRYTVQVEIADGPHAGQSGGRCA